MDHGSCLFRCRSQPRDSFPVFEKSALRNRWTSLRMVVMVYHVSMNTKQSLALVPTQRLPSRSKRQCAKTASLLPSNVGVTNGLTAPSFNRPSPCPGREYADPERSVGTTRQAHDPVLPFGSQRFDRVHLRNAVMPMDKGRLSSQPKAAFPVSQYRYRSGKSVFHPPFRNTWTAWSVTWQRGASECRASHHPQ